MIYYCNHKGEKINSGKVKHYCLKQDCWALKMFSNVIKLKHYIKKNKTCKSLKKGL